MALEGIYPFPYVLLLHPFNDLFSRPSRYQKGKTSLDLNEARDDGVLESSGISWTICKQHAPRSRKITTPTPHHSIFYTNNINKVNKFLTKQVCVEPHLSALNMMTPAANIN